MARQWLKPALAISLFVNLVGLVAGIDAVIAGLAAIPASIATFITGIAGLGMVAWQTNRGLKNVIRGQSHRAKIERQARNHQAEIATAELSRKALNEKKALASIIAAELMNLVDLAQNRVHSELSVSKEYARMATIKPNHAIPIASFNCPLFDANSSNIGVLGYRTCLDIIETYGCLTLLNETPGDGTVLVGVYDSFMAVRKKRSVMFIARASHAIMQLESIFDEKPPQPEFHNSDFVKAYIAELPS
jgi:hypothetical protein